MRTKIKRNRYYDGCRNHMRPKSNFLNTYGVGDKKYFLNDDNFDTENGKYENVEHGLSKRSYKVSNYNDEMNNYDDKLNRGKKKKRRRRRRNFEGSMSSRELRRIFGEEF